MTDMPEVKWKTLVAGTPPIKICCQNCGSEDVTRDAVVRWCVENQEWEVSNVFDNADCDNCGETKLVEKEIQ